jgi:uncharacterized protein YjbI with pentapeptide repeats
MNGPEGQKQEAPAGERSTFVAAGLGSILFAIGMAAGALLAFSGEGLIFANLSIALGAFLIAFLLIGSFGILIFLFRRPILRTVFGVADAQIEAVAQPLSDVARHAVRGEPDAAVDAARTLAQVVLARYAWTASRRWVIASLTGLIAALAALAGTTLLFRQNELLAEQTRVLTDQSLKIDRQTALLETTIELTEAQRSAEILALIADIADRLGAGVAAARAAGAAMPFDLARDLEPGLVNRIVVASLAARPYRYLDTAESLRTDRDAVRAAARQRPDLPRLAAAYGGTEAPRLARLIPSALSPERGLLLAALYHNGVLATEPLSWRGADFSHADMRVPMLSLASYGFATLAGASFAGLTLTEVNFAGAVLHGAVFRDAILTRCRFGALEGAAIAPPFGPRDFPAVTLMTGADFSASVLAGTGFAGSRAMLARFDGALIEGVSFAGTALDGATFRGAVIVDADFARASLKSTDFDGAFVFEADFLDRLAREAAPESFSRSRFEQEPVPVAEVWQNPVAWAHVGAEVPEARIAGRQPFRIRRLAPFD